MLTVSPSDLCNHGCGYDSPAIYEQVHRNGSRSVIAYNKRNETEPVGFDSHFAPTCVREHSYRYDSFDARYETLKYTRPKECATCPLASNSLCQKVFKIKITTNLRGIAYLNEARRRGGASTHFEPPSNV